LINSIRNKLYRIIKVSILLSLLITSCNPTKYVPDDKYLLNSVKIQIKDKSVKEQALKSYLKQKPNKKILGWFRFHLGVYNLSNIKKEKGFNKFLREKIGEKPEIYDPYLKTKTVTQFRIFLKNKGYYNPVIKDSVNFNKKKANIIYYIEGGKPYTIRNIKYAIQDTNILKICMADSANSLLKRGELFDIDFVLQNDRVRLERLLRNNGYYNLNKEYIFYPADTFLNHQVDLSIEIQNPVSLPINNTSVQHKQYKVRQIIISGMLDPQDIKTIRTTNDTIDTGKGILIKDIKVLRINPRSFIQFIYIQPGKLYSENSVEETYTHVSSLNLFKMVDIKFTELNTLPDTSDFLWLDCNIKLSPSPLQSYQTDLVGTNSSGNIGGALNLSYQHINLFRNAEVLDVKIQGAVESLREKTTADISRTTEIGIEANIKFPKFLIPVRNENFIKKNNPKTNLTLAYNYQHRPEYKRTVANASFGYAWKETRLKEHVFKPLEVNYVDISDPSDDFNSYISGTILESSYRPHLITSISYSYIFNNQNIKKNRNFRYFRFNTESAGLGLSAFNSYLEKASDSLLTYHKLLGIQYSQYVRSDVEFKYSKIINSYSNLMYRAFAGLALPYGNASAIPFEKRYFSGGSNGLRGWQLMDLGPGSYADTSQSQRYPNSTGDVKLELNVEYRFKLFWILEGALFVDAGNIWAITKEDNRPGALFQWDKFYKDIAIDSGIGLRFDLEFVLFRTDLGMKMRDPGLNAGNRWITGTRKLQWNDFAFNIGIGYPF